MKNKALTEFVQKHIHPEACVCIGKPVAKRKCGGCFEALSEKDGITVGEETCIYIRKGNGVMLSVPNRLDSKECLNARNLLTIAADKSDGMRSYALRSLLEDKLEDHIFDAYAASLGFYGNRQVAVFYINSGKAKSKEICGLIGEAFLPTEEVLALELDSNTAVMVKILNEETKEDITDIAGALIATVIDELDTAACVGISIKNSYRELNAGYKEAVKAIELGKKRFPGRLMFFYSDFVLYEILDEISEETLKNFKKNIIGNRASTIFDREMLMTVKVLFEHNLNISSAARALYVHRNSLIYRIDKLLNQTGLDIRNFEDAVMLRILLSDELANISI